jgi:hypothetical protein
MDPAFQTDPAGFGISALRIDNSAAEWAYFL